MERVRKHVQIGIRWLRNGWQLFLRNPWLLGGMGLTAAVMIGIFQMVPLLGGLLTALAAPVMLASTYRALDPLYRNNMRLPDELRLPALKQSPLQLWSVFRSEQKITPTVAAGVLCVSAVLLVHLTLRMVGGQAWVADWSNLDMPTMFGIFALALYAFLTYLLLAAALIYALPLVLFRDEPLVPALRQSLKASRHFTMALSVLLTVLLVPFVLGVITALWSPWSGYLTWIGLSAIIYPVVSAGLYCSYHDIFSARERWKPADRRHQTDQTGPEERSLRPS